jgi:hypothetical protein
MIVGARMEASTEAALTIGWYTETFARTKRLKSLAKLLETNMTPAKKANSGASKLAARFREIQRTQKEKANVAG